MDYCDEHRDCRQKINDLCFKSAAREERIQFIEEEMQTIKNELWLNPTSLRQRVKGMEDSNMNLEKIILENRDVVRESLRGMFKVFILTVSAAAFIISVCFGVLWVEMKDIQKAQHTTQSMVKHEVSR